MKTAVKFAIAVSIAFVSMLTHTNSVLAQDFTISQKDLRFSTPIKVIHPGDRIIFANEDSVTHNVVSLTNGFQFDLGAFQPGMKRTVNFNDIGVVDVECTVHPDMKLTLFIF